ncbi:hypothetical protein PIB30_063272 [Stylosanthes scabra]|uniref:Uncharacterized protein n=1 Tax=Stylosanthes scabra TaxID=79078 RepID=A0ABU6UNV4_9FABA|nr:hypothetical protein [Stylosanthes scabra]
MITVVIQGAQTFPLGIKFKSASNACFQAINQFSLILLLFHDRAVPGVVNKISSPLLKCFLTYGADAPPPPHGCVVMADFAVKKRGGALAPSGSCGRAIN